MKLNIVQNFGRNVVFGTIAKFISLLFPFLIRSIVIRTLGLEYAGLNGLFSAILDALNLVELGLGSAIVFNMYKPIAENNNDKLCTYLNFYKKCYRVIGLIILVGGLIMIPFLKYIINDSYPSDINIYILYLIYLSNTVFSYWFLAYKNSLALAYQRTDIENRVMIITQILMYVLQMIILLTFKSYYYIITLPIFTAIKNIIISKQVDKLYPNIKPKGEINKEEARNIFNKVKALFGHQMCSTVIHSFDTIFLVRLIGLAQETIYNNYYLIFNSLFGVLSILVTSIQAGIGNDIITTDSNEKYSNYEKYRLMFFIIVELAVACLFTLYNPFMTIWVGEDLTLNELAAFVFAIGFFITQTRRACATYKNAAGLWSEDFWMPYCVILVDVIFDILLIKKVGCIGAMLSTIISVGLIQTPWEAIITYKYVFNKKPTDQFKFIFKELLFTLMSIVILSFSMKLITFTGIFGLIVKLIVTLIIVIPLCILFHYKDTNFLWLIKRIKTLILTKE